MCKDLMIFLRFTILIKITRESYAEAKSSYNYTKFHSICNINKINDE